MNAIDMHFSAAFDLKYVIRHYTKLLLCIHISGIHMYEKRYRQIDKMRL